MMVGQDSRGGGRPKGQPAQSRTDLGPQGESFIGGDKIEGTFQASQCLRGNLDT